MITKQALEAQGCKCVMNVEPDELYDAYGGRTWYWIVTPDGYSLGCDWSDERAWDTAIYFYDDGEERFKLPEKETEWMHLDGTPYTPPQAVTA